MLLAVLISSAVALAGCSRDSPDSTIETPDAAPSVAASDEIRFPRRLTGGAGAVVAHAPQIDSWADFRKVTARNALEVTFANGSPMLIGTGRFTAATEVDLESRVVTLYDVEAERFSFPGASPEAAARASALVRALMRKEPQKVPLDLLLSYLADSTQRQTLALRMDPPPIFVAHSPAILVVLNGKAVTAPIAGSDASFAVNTNWDLFHARGAWYLLNQDQWLTTGDLVSTWAVTTTLPASLEQLPDDGNWSNARAHVPPQASSSPAPRVFVSEQPSELILIDGEPRLEPIGDGGLSYVANTASDLFMIDAKYYYLASGRWFVAPALDAKWQAAGPLPAAFAAIPEGHAKAHVLVSVPGTEAARLAVQNVSIPRTAVVNRSAQPAMQVTYNGEAQFAPIPGTSLSRASNSMSDVIRAGGQYFLCYDALWYVAATPTGPWAVAASVPPEIYSIPPSSPAYHVTHVKIYESTDSVVTTGYTGGYYGAYSTGTTVVYGTGYMYPPYVYAAALYPIYYWHPYSYGYGSWYNPNSGAFGEAAAIYGPYGGAGRTAAYNPQTGTYRRGYAVWDSDEIAGTARAYNPRTGTGALTNRYATEDEAWGQTAIVRGDEWVYAQSERHGDTRQTDLETSRGGEGSITATLDGDTVTREAELSRGEHSISSSGERTDGGYSGSFETSGGATGTVNRSFDDGDVSREAQVARNGQSTTISGTTERTDGGLQTTFETSGGASGTVSREVEDGQVHRSGEITHDGQSAETDFVRGAEGSVGRIESEGESVGVGRSENGDLYAAKDGELYRRTEGGDWEQHDGSGWSQTAQAQTTSASRSAETARVNELERERGARERGMQQYDRVRQQPAQAERTRPVRRRR